LTGIGLDADEAAGKIALNPETTGSGSAESPFRSLHSQKKEADVPPFFVKLLWP
jgi:hypothetical protein